MGDQLHHQKYRAQKPKAAWDLVKQWEEEAANIIDPYARVQGISHTQSTTMEGCCGRTAMGSGSVQRKQRKQGRGANRDIRPPETDAEQEDQVGCGGIRKIPTTTERKSGTDPARGPGGGCGAEVDDRGEAPPAKRKCAGRGARRRRRGGMGGQQPYRGTCSGGDKG